MKKLIVIVFLLGLVVPVYADAAKDLSHEYNLVFADFLREKIEKLPTDSLVEVYLKNGKKVIGIFGGFVAYDDSVFVRPLEAHGFFKEEAYDVNELEDIRKIKLVQVN